MRQLDMPAIIQGVARLGPQAVTSLPGFVSVDGKTI